MNVLVTGGTGYIGSHTAVELIERGYHPVLIDNLSNSHEGVVRSIEKITGKPVDFYNIDLCDRMSLSKLLDTIQIDAVIHFAAFKAVGESVEQPLLYYRNNILSLLNLLEETIRRGIDKFVFSSSCTVYGDTDKSPVEESERLGIPSSPYGQTKLIGESLLRDSAKAYGIKCISLRYFNPAGAHESALIGENPLNAPNNLVPVITRAAAGKTSAVTVFGNDYPTPDGTCVRDYIHVCDLGRAHVLALEKLVEEENSISFDVYNLGSGKGSSVMDVINAFETVTGKKLPFIIGPRRPGDVVSIWADPSKANRELGWKAEHSLKHMMSSAWAWEMAQQTIQTI